MSERIGAEQERTAARIRLPFFYGWLLVGVSFVSMAIAVNARTAFSLLFPPILDEFGWDRGVTAGAFSFGFLISAIVTPCVGWLTDRRGPRLMIETGVVLMGSGLLLATLIKEPWELYLTLGALVGGGVNVLAYTAQSMYLINWFVRRRGLALSIAFSGVGLGSITILPWLQTLIAGSGWRTACWYLGLLVLLVLAPINLLFRRHPADLGVEPDGGSGGGIELETHIRQRMAVSTDWTLGRALRTRGFWWLAASYFCGLFTWYVVQVHQTKYLMEVGFAPSTAAWALGFVSLVAVPGQIALGHLSDRIGREWVWTIGNGGFVVSCVALLALPAAPTALLLWVMVIAQGTVGYGLTSVMGAIPADRYGGRHFGSIFGTAMVAAISGGAAGPWIGGISHDLTGSYVFAFTLSAACSAFSAIAIWRGVSRPSDDV
jgi:MFS family permease